MFSIIYLSINILHNICNIFQNIYEMKHFIMESVQGLKPFIN